MRVVSVAFLAMVPEPPSPGWHRCRGRRVEAGSRSRRKAARVRPPQDPGRRHRTSSRQARVHDLATAFCPPEFTIAELREVYEAIWNERLDPRNFSRKVLSAADFVTPTNGTTTRGGGRPARLYRAGQASESAHSIAKRDEPQTQLRRSRTSDIGVGGLLASSTCRMTTAAPHSFGGSRRRHAARASRDFRRLWLGLLASTFGSQFTIVATFLQVYSLTCSTVANGQRVGSSRSWWGRWRVGRSWTRSTVGRS